MDGYILGHQLAFADQTIPIMNGKPDDDLFKVDNSCFKKYDGNGAKVKNQPNDWNFSKFMTIYLKTNNSDGMLFYLKPLGKIAYIERSGGGFQKWQILATEAEVDDLKSKINALEKSIGGVNSSAICYVRKALSYFSRLEVA